MKLSLQELSWVPSMTRSINSSLIVTAVAVLCLGLGPKLISARECNSIDVRNSVASLNLLENCTVVKGYLMIVLLTKDVSTSDYGNYTFPHLREITDFFILHDVRRLITLKTLLPNLTVIRGRRLFLNYALAVSEMPDLAALEFKSLIAVQRGHIYIGKCPKLCFLEKVNWDRLTLSPGENHIIPMEQAICPPVQCRGCPSEYCWSDMVCQKFENDNVANIAMGSRRCHPECLGGCYNTTNTGCVVCKGITDHGACVRECPSDLYYSENHQRCYTKSECRAVRFIVHGNECNRHCPTGYSNSTEVGECIKCAAGCNKVCIPSDEERSFWVTSLTLAYEIEGCYRLHGNLYIEFRNKIDEKELLRAFRTLRIINGHIRIISSPFLTSLEFLRNIERIDGNPLQNDTFALFIYNNGNLTELWTPADGKTVELNGGIFSYSNYKLCNSAIKKFMQRAIHDKDKNLIQLNDQEVLCDPAKLTVDVHEISQDNATVSWARNQTAEEVEILYREAQYDKGEESELDDHVCERVNWKRDLLFAADIPHNSSHYLYQIVGLKPLTHYEVLVKTFQEKNDYSARSPIHRFDTLPDYPSPPKLHTLAKTADTITLALSLTKKTEIVTYFLLEEFEQPANLSALDSRNYCETPMMVFGSKPIEDYQDCCLRIQEEMEDRIFRESIEEKFSCNSDLNENCHNMITYGLQGISTKIDSRVENYTVINLKPFTLYTFLVYGCNQIGCGTYNMHSDKTNFSVDADEIKTLEACVVFDTNEYHLRFDEPSNPNGAITSYIIHFQKTQKSDYAGMSEGQLNCVTRQQHKNAGFEYVSKLNDTFQQAAVRSTSLAGSVLSKWVDIGSCQQFEHEGGINALGAFVIGCIIVTLVAAVWTSIRKQWWRKLNLISWRRRTQATSATVSVEDRQLLVAAFDTVRFQNNTDD